MKKYSLPSFSLPRINTLIYHRIDISITAPCSICVSIKNFEEQVRFLKNNFKKISSGDLAKKGVSGNITEDTIFITFDDGYADNYTNAKSIIEKYNCPATFFISTAFIDSPMPFWWGELEIILIHSIKLPGNLLLAINGENHSYTFDKSKLAEKQLLQHATWKWHDAALTYRCKIFLQIWEQLRALPNDAIQTSIEVLRKWASPNISSPPIPMNGHQLAGLSNNPLFTIAMHTHPDLKGKEMNFQMEEMLAYKKSLATKYSIDSRCMAYPFSRYDSNTIKAVENLRIQACFTTAPATINAYSDKTILGRYQAFNDGSPSLKK